MTIYTIRTNDKELDRITTGAQRFIIRSGEVNLSTGKIFQFQDYRNGLPADHMGNNTLYQVTFIADSNMLPINEGCKLIAFKEAA